MGSPGDEPGRYDDEGPQHEIRLTRGYWMGETPVTQEQWRAVAERGKSGLLEKIFGLKKVKGKPSHFQGSGDLPVESVNWEDCLGFCEMLNEVETDGPNFQLPTEAQWEYACRAGTQGAFQDGSQCGRDEELEGSLENLGWFDGNSGNKTQAVKGKEANGWGLYDCHGNVWEWCRDAWNGEAYRKRKNGVNNPEEDSEEEDPGCVVRGGSWSYPARFCRAAFRFGFDPGNRFRIQGLRLSAGHEPEAAEPPGRRGGAVPGGPEGEVRT